MNNNPHGLPTCPHGTFISSCCERCDPIKVESRVRELELHSALKMENSLLTAERDALLREAGKL